MMLMEMLMGMGGEGSKVSYHVLDSGPPYDTTITSSVLHIIYLSD